MIYYDGLTGMYFKGSDDLVTQIFKDFYVDEVKMAKDTWECELTKTARIVSIKYYYDWLVENVYVDQSFLEVADRVVDLFSDRKIRLDLTTALSEHEIVVVLNCQFTMC